MSLLDNLSKKFNSKNVTLSVRVTNEENAVLQEIADVIGCTRQDVIYQLISDYAFPEWRKMKDEDEDESIDFIEEKKGVSYFLLNTNKTNSIFDHELILEQGIAAAFEDGYIGKINRIKKDDVVFLYESGSGIVAYGIASGQNIDEANPEKFDHKSMRYQILSDFTLLKKPLAAREVKQVLDKDIPFAQTLSRVANGEVLYKHLKK
jgi:predicted transcriptional regulator